MPLTPADVRNKQFSTTRLRPGYDEEEVDAFLDEVEAELDRLMQENEELRAKLAECLRGGKSAVPALSSPLSDPKPFLPAPPLLEPERMEPERRQPEPVMMGGMPHVEDNMASAARGSRSRSRPPTRRSPMLAGKPTRPWDVLAARRTRFSPRRGGGPSRSPVMRGPGRKASSVTPKSGTVKRWGR